MMQSGTAFQDTDRDRLVRLIRSSRAMDASTRKHWLMVLDRLLPSQRQRLFEILSAEAEEPPGDQASRS
ncbi:MAG: hypothetical protein EXR51_06590 [Dehalococcoidia bacterium]|nr:hypothetical protein [Dehalococcoidia bacterium]